ncbi:MAG TPA: prepilin-type N-terminal cleavage/methylation domain-containing protein [Rhodopila sp.]|uniref:prepilin-type N-terminal cleavage/methylation domain-containing protein n=1 Tax=Rhodopila sp. TaxID=2480087 RepID=UPI002CDF2843|nr:prepilin-type N-terminal cleavage/methylation domain-containing protein [Rhodopila sp.]HVY17107.1 prepilin-type N-terminal cleavage/methylation domain-containing protein [Rhodopila sp.]
MKARQAGFTLIETMVAVVILGLILVGLSQTVRLAMTSWQTEVRLTKRNVDFLKVDNALRPLIRDLQPGGGIGPPPLIGTPDLLSGVSRMAIPSLGPGRSLVQIGLGRSGNRLVVRWSPYMPGLPAGRPVPPPEEETIATNIDRVVISYGANGTWTDHWTQSDLPQLVRIHVVLAGEHAPRWPDFVIAPIQMAP